MQKLDVIYSSKVSDDISITYDGDLHYSSGMELDFLYSQLDSFERDPTTYYFLLGDLVNDSKISKEDLIRLKDILAKIAKTKTKICAILGNHDQVTKSENNGWIEYYNQDYVNMLRDIDGFNLLENESVRDGGNVIYGTRFSSDYYDGDNKEPISQYVAVMDNLLDYEGEDTFNILLDHSPYRSFDKKSFELIPNLIKIDVIFSGHFHNGLIPNCLDSFIPGNFGLIAYNKLFPKNARGKKNITDSTVGFISPAVTTFADHYNKIQKLNVFYPPVQKKVLVKKNR